MNRAKGYDRGERSRLRCSRTTAPGSRRPRRSGENLADLSLDELAARIELYRGEIERLTHEIEAKQKSRNAADTFFRR